MFDTAMNEAVRQARQDTAPLAQHLRSALSTPQEGRAAWQVPELVSSLDAGASWAERNLWLIRALQWLAHGDPRALAGATPTPVLRLRYFMRLLGRQPELRAQVGALLRRLWFEGDAASLFADCGHRGRQGLWAALGVWLRQRCLPATADTADLATLFRLLVQSGVDLGWVEDIDGPTLQRLADLFADGMAARADARAPLAQAMRWLTTTVVATALAPGLRQRIAHRPRDLRALESLPAAVDDYLLRRSDPGPERLHAANHLRALIQVCHQACEGAMEQLRLTGVSIGLLLDLEQLHLRLDRLEGLLNLMMAARPAQDLTRLLGRLAAAARERRSLRGFFAEHNRLLARKLAERHALTGERYVARDRGEYLDLLRQAAGGGAVVAPTALAKFALLALALAPFWSGLAAGILYAASFVGIYLMHWTLATKQPAMTAPALTARLADVQASHGSGTRRATEAFVDEIAALTRSQVAAVLGNLGAVIPVTAALQGLAWWLWGRPLVDVQAAHHVLDSLSLRGPTPLYAALTGVLLFAASLAGGWAENAFCFHQLQSAIATHPLIVARLGSTRAQRWARGSRLHVNGLASNLTLGLLLGAVAPLGAFLGLPLDVRHVTLSTAQLTAAVGSLGWQTLLEPAFWWCAAGIGVIGLLNLAVSFWLALRMAMRARGVSVGDKQRLRSALSRRVRLQPLSFLLTAR